MIKRARERGGGRGGDGEETKREANERKAVCVAARGGPFDLYLFERGRAVDAQFSQVRSLICRTSYGVSTIEGQRQSSM